MILTKVQVSFILNKTHIHIHTTVTKNSMGENQTNVEAETSGVDDG